ncbi:MAG: CHC2 zinc finger domain-containing protein [Patescibacteria group bacterium]|nr:CHC2 zinc finger domain-containing protein [Patescibacteria group bacterium]
MRFSQISSCSTVHYLDCTKQGNVLTFVMEIERLDFLGAVKLLADRAGIDFEEEIYEEKNKRHSY